jgi:uncharacterized protein
MTPLASLVRLRFIHMPGRIASGLRPSKWLPMWLLAWAFALVLGQGPVHAEAASAAQVEVTGTDVSAVPALTGHVIDQTQTLGPSQRQALDDKLVAFERKRGTQLVVLLVPTTQPEDIAAYAQRVGESWKIGRRDVGDGLLLIVAKQDRTVRIEVAKTLEGAVPDLAAKQIIDRAITPAFKAGDFAGGLNQGVDHLMARIEGENLPLPKASSGTPQGKGGFDLNNLLVFGLIGVPVVFSLLSAMFGRKGGALVTGMLCGGAAWLVTTSAFIALGAWVASSLLALSVGNGGRGFSGGGLPMGGWRGGGSGGGGWSSGGGGDFGGGGASGRW